LQGDKIRWRDFCDEGGDFGFVGVADDVEDAGESGEFFGSALGVATGGDDFSDGICGVEFADGVAGLGVGSGGDGAGVDDDDVGAGGSRGEVVALGAELALDGGGVGLCSTTTELLNVEGRHGVAQV
jgi:hypothetical protein